MPKNFRLTVLLGLCAALGWPQLSRAQTAAEFFGQKTIKFLITYEPGGSYDLYARLVTMHLPKHLAGHPGMVMQYMPGAGGLLGTLHLYDKAPHDGSELAILPRDIAINQMLRPDIARYDARRFNWIGTLSSYAGVYTKAPPVDLSVEDLPEGDRYREPAGSVEGDEGAMSRINLRMPNQLKGRIEQAAGTEGLSVNSWLVRAATAALERTDPGRRREPRSPHGAQRYTGWAR